MVSLAKLALLGLVVSLGCGGGEAGGTGGKGSGSGGDRGSGGGLGTGGIPSSNGQAGSGAGLGIGGASGGSAGSGGHFGGSGGSTDRGGVTGASGGSTDSGGVTGASGGSTGNGGVTGASGGSTGSGGGPGAGGGSIGAGGALGASGGAAGKGSSGGSGSGGSGGMPSGTSVCDIFAAGSTPCVAAHSTVRALYGAYSGNLYQITRASDQTTKDVGVVNAGGFANSATQDSFCAGTTCTISIIYDQSGRNNHLKQGPPGQRKETPDTEADATALKLTISGRTVYGVHLPVGYGYRVDQTAGDRDRRPAGDRIHRHERHVLQRQLLLRLRKCRDEQHRRWRGNHGSRVFRQLHPPRKRGWQRSMGHGGHGKWRLRGTELRREPHGYAADVPVCHRDGDWEIRGRSR